MNKGYKKIFNFAVVFSMSILVLWSFRKLFLLSYNHWLEPTIFADSFNLLAQGGDSKSLINWIFSQHNEHRITFTKLITLLEVNFFKISPGQSALFQNLLLILLSCFLWTKINQKLFRNNNLKIITILSGMTLILNPWQWRNFNWEFQPPWFFINVLLLLSTLVLFKSFRVNYKNVKYLNLLLISIPWLAMYSSGQGIALALALSLASFIKDKNLGIKVSISTICSLLTYFIFFEYIKPIDHSNYNFDFTFFFAILFGGIWHGLFFLVLITSIAILIFRPRINRELLAPLSLPILFSFIFALMVTLSRSSMGINLAGRFEYITHTLMLGLTSILILGIIAERNKKKIYFPLIGVSALLITFGGFPQTLIFDKQHPNFRGYSFLSMWKHMEKNKKEIKNNFLCIADSAAFKAKSIYLDCGEFPHVKDLGPDYFSNNLKVKPVGWHKLHSVSSLNEGINQILIKYKIEDLSSFHPNNIKIKGSALTYSKFRGPERFFIVATYESSQQKVISYVNNKIKIPNKKNNLNQFEKTFEIIVPRISNGFTLENISLETRNSTEVILNKKMIKKFITKNKTFSKAQGSNY